MANVAFKKGLLANLPKTYKEGTFYVTTDEQAIYLDVDGSTRIRIGDFQEVANIAALASIQNPNATALYYAAAENVLCKHNGSSWVKINMDTGATSVEVVGSGNAVTAASYDEVSRKLTLTMGKTFTTAGDVDAKIAAKVGEIGDDTVKAYVDKKTEDIASDEALTQLGERVTAAEGDIDALGALVGETSVADQIDAKIAALDLSNTYETKGAANAAKAELIGGDEDTGTNDTIKGAKKYADTQIAAQVASAYKAAGSVDFASLPALSATEEGKVYNVTDAFSTTENFIEGAGKSYPAGTNVVCIDTGDETFKWDVLAGMVDLSAYDTAKVAAGKVATAKQEAITAAAADATSKANAALEDAKEYANGLAVNYDAAGSADAAEAAAKAYTDTALTWGSFDVLT